MFFKPFVAISVGTEQERPVVFCATFQNLAGWWVRLQFQLAQATACPCIMEYWRVVGWVQGVNSDRLRSRCLEMSCWTARSRMNRLCN